MFFVGNRKFETALLRGPSHERLCAPHRSELGACLESLFGLEKHAIGWKRSCRYHVGADNLWEHLPVAILLVMYADVMELGREGPLVLLSKGRASARAYCHSVIFYYHIGGG